LPNPLEYIEIQCPYCGESFNVEVDVSAGDQTYIEDILKTARFVVPWQNCGST